MNRAKISYAGWQERLLANLIDTIIMLLPSAMIAKLMNGSEIGLLAAFLANAAYYTVFTSSRWQATPGKRMLAIHVIRTDGKLLSQRDALERFLAYVMPTLPIYLSFLPDNTATILVLWLGLFWFSPILYTPQRVGLHDRLCGTRVVIGKIA